MAQRAHVKDGKVVCSSCSAVLAEESVSCPQCSEALEGDMEGMVCPYCAAVLRRFSTECSQCGLRFKAVKKPSSEKATEDQEFLKKLLEWGKKMQVESEGEETEEDIAEKEQAHTVMKTVIGTKAPTPTEKETLVQIEKSAQEKLELETREEHILTIAEPLEAALKARQASIQEAEVELDEISKEMDELNSRQDPRAVSKREKLERKKALLEQEKAEIKRLEERLNEIDETYKRLLAEHKRELDAKEASLKERLDAFKKEMERREDEKRRLEKKEAMLRIQEREAATSMERLKERERELEARENEVKRQLDEVKAHRDAIASGGSSPSTVGMDGKWVVDPTEVEEVFKKSKRAREDWFEEQKRMQREILALRKGGGESGGSGLPQSEVITASAMPELDSKISILEAKVVEMERERAALKAKEEAAAELDSELKKVLKMVDDLLGNLPDDVIDRFAKSDEFKAYERIIDRYLGGA